MLFKSSCCLWEIGTEGTASKVRRITGGCAKIRDRKVNLHKWRPRGTLSTRKIVSGPPRAPMPHVHYLHEPVITTWVISFSSGSDPLTSESQGPERVPSNLDDRLCVRREMHYWTEYVAQAGLRMVVFPAAFLALTSPYFGFMTSHSHHEIRWPMLALRPTKLAYDVVKLISEIAVSGSLKSDRTPQLAVRHNNEQWLREI